MNLTASKLELLARCPSAGALHSVWTGPSEDQRAGTERHRFLQRAHEISPAEALAAIPEDAPWRTQCDALVEHLEAELAVQTPCAAGDQHLPLQAGEVGVLLRALDHPDRKAFAAVGLVDEHVAQPCERRSVGDVPTEAHLDAVGAEHAEVQ